MYIVSYEDHGREPRNLAVASSLESAKDYINKQLGAVVPDDEWDIDEYARIIYCFGDAQYVIELVQNAG